MPRSVSVYAPVPLAIRSVFGTEPEDLSLLHVLFYMGSAGGFEDFPGLIANENPWEFIHKVRFGQPGTAMTPQDAVLDMQGLSNLGAHAKTLPMASP
mgnify:CR=1 FL=1